MKASDLSVTVAWPQTAHVTCVNLQTSQSEELHAAFQKAAELRGNWVSIFLTHNNISWLVLIPSSTIVFVNHPRKTKDFRYAQKSSQALKESCA